MIPEIERSKFCLLLDVNVLLIVGEGIDSFSFTFWDLRMLVIALYWLIYLKIYFWFCCSFVLFQRIYWNYGYWHLCSFWGEEFFELFFCSLLIFIFVWLFFFSSLILLFFNWYCWVDFCLRDHVLLFLASRIFLEIDEWHLAFLILFWLHYLCVRVDWWWINFIFEVNWVSTF